MKLHDYLPSGNGYKVRLLLSWLEANYEFLEVDIHKGRTRTPEFLALNPCGQIPVLITDNGRILAESNAILYYLAQGSPYWPGDSFEQSETLRWMFFEQYKHEPGIAVARYIRMYAPGERKNELPALMHQGNFALGIMDKHLSQNDFFAGNRISIADIALYAYTHVANEGGFNLSGYLFVKSWLARIKAHPGYVKITDTPA